MPDFDSESSVTSSSSEITYSNKVREGTLGAIGKIPKVGGPIKFIAGIFWPKSKVDIWDLIKDQTEALIDKKLLIKELEVRKADLEGLKLSMSQYDDALTNEKAHLLVSMLNTINTLFFKFKQSANAVHFIPHTILMAHLHLLLLRERAMLGKELFKEDNSEVWKNELSIAIETYLKYSEDIWDEWKEYRMSLVTLEGHTWTDGITDEVVYLPTDDNGKILEKRKDLLEQRFISEQGHQIMDLLTTCFYFKHYHPDYTGSQPVPLRNIGFKNWLGPYTPNESKSSGETQNNFSRGHVEKESGYGHITAVEISEYERIDSFKLEIDHVLQEFIGASATGGEKHYLEVPDGHEIVGVNCLFGAQLSRMTFELSNGEKLESENKHYDKGGLHSFNASINAPTDYPLLGVKAFVPGTNSIGINDISFCFGYKLSEHENKFIRDKEGKE